MSKVRFELSHAGVRELLRGEAMQAVLQEYADAAVGRLGEGYGTSVYVGKNRANVSIGAETAEAYRENLENNTILKAVGG